ncbi:UPF0182 family protein [Kineosporia sp. J2-2]|uniref:UPF0182 protein KIH74_03760 n=1 Tax=Kineosporia corallincola TaxID=2835133 RepID=A0ABS5TAD8_9ACTN|nr:UPF0182 family protein [Kineosporia corallincola]MBT0768025.1 UPF0182 family protein [Kineosporia corallincola]
MTYERDPRGPRPVLNRRRRGALAPTLITLGVLIVLGLIASQMWTEVLWFQSVGYTQVYRTELLTKIALFVLGALVMGAAVAASLIIGYRSRPIYAPMSTEQVGLDRYRESIEPLRRLVGLAVPIVLGLFAGSAASQQWQTVQLWLHRVPFGEKDPQFKMDIGFFVFTLPWLQFLVSFLTAAVFLSAIAALVTHYLYGGLRVQGAGQRLTSAARVHLFVLAASFLVLRGLDYWLGRYALSTKTSRLITGLTYTDANAGLTSRGILAGVAMIIAVLFIVAAFVERARLIPLYGTALLVVSAIVIGGIYPAGVQRFQVQPSAQELENKYIQRNIQATRDAYGLDNIKTETYNAESDADQADLRESAEAIPGIRLQDPALVSPTFSQLQQIKQYYSFADTLDVDKYTIDGETSDAVVAARELNIDAAPSAQRNWVNDHIVYTHGYGLVAAYGNERTSDGEPVFLQSGIPSTGELGDYEPRIYFGENSPDYSIVGAPEGADPQELDIPDDESDSGQVNYTYQGDGGVDVGSTLRQLLYSIKFQDQNILLSNQVNSDSQILYDRSPRERVEKVAPFLELDGDPYPAVVNGKITWIIDAYTTTSQYPYSKTQVLEDATSDSITETTTAVNPLDNTRVNYIRNSVKATVDAYDGTVTLYTWDDEDPILKAWTKVFPNTVKPIGDISSQLMSHLRYPEDLFKVQRELLQQYHVTDANAFYSQQDFWTVPDDPTRDGGNSLQPPYYLTLQMPGTDTTNFSLTSTFIPAGRTRGVLTGFLAVDADAGDTAGKPREDYGQLRLLQLPKDTVISGPSQVQNTFNSDPDVSYLLNQLQRGSDSSVQRGNLLTLPLAGGLLYVQPVYVKGSGATAYPLLQKVLVSFGDEIGFADDLDGALDQVFGEARASDGDDSGDDSGGGDTSGDSAVARAQASLQSALDDASKAFKEGQTALQSSDFAAYGQAQTALEDALQRATEAETALEAAQQAAGATATATPSTSATPSSTPSSTQSSTQSATPSPSGTTSAG